MTWYAAAWPMKLPLPREWFVPVARKAQGR